LINTRSSGILTTVPIPIKVVLGVAMALMLQAVLLACRAMCEGDMIVCNVVKEVEFILVEHQSCSDGMHRCIAPAFVEEATSMIQRGEIIDVRI